MECITLVHKEWKVEKLYNAYQVFWSVQRLSSVTVPVMLTYFQRLRSENNIFIFHNWFMLVDEKKKKKKIISNMLDVFCLFSLWG